MSNKQFASLISTMPPLRHSIPDRPFNIRESEVVNWLIKNDDVLQYLFNKAKDTERMTFDKGDRVWVGNGSAPEELA